MLVSGEYFSVLGARPRAGGPLAPQTTSRGARTRGRGRVTPSGARRLRGDPERDRAPAVAFAASSMKSSASCPRLQRPLDARRRSLGAVCRRAARHARLGSRSATATSRHHSSPGFTDGRECGRGRDAGHGAVAGRRVSLRGIVGADVAAADQRVAWWLGGVSMLVLADRPRQHRHACWWFARAHFAMTSRCGRRSAPRGGHLIAHSAASKRCWSPSRPSRVVACWRPGSTKRCDGSCFPACVARSSVRTTAIVTAAVAGVLGFLVAADASASGICRRTRRRSSSPVMRAGGIARTRTMTGLLRDADRGVGAAARRRRHVRPAASTSLWSQDFGMEMDDVLIVDFEQGPERIAGQDEMFERGARRGSAQLPGVQHGDGRSMRCRFRDFTCRRSPCRAAPSRRTSAGSCRFCIAATPEFLEDPRHPARRRTAADRRRRSRRPGRARESSDGARRLAG